MVVVEIDSVLGYGPQIRLVFGVTFENDLGFVSVVDIDLVSMPGIEFDIISASGSVLICFVYGGRT